MRSALFFLLIFGLSQQAYSKEIVYFPKGAVKNESRGWYSGHLDVMGEQPLWKARIIPETYVYRYLLISVLEDPICIRIDIEPGRPAHLTIKQMVRPEPSQTEYIKKEIEMDLSGDQIAEFLKLFREKVFWQVPSNTQAIRFGGVQWVIEGVKRGKYRLFESWAAGKRDYPHAAFYLLETAGITFEDDGL